MSHDRCQTMRATRARGDRALQYVVDEIVRILQEAAAAGPGEEG
jgi:hypothetical protein